MTEEDHNGPVEYDPFAAGLRGQLQNMQQALWIQTARQPSRWERWRFRAAIRFRERWLDDVLLAVPLILIASAAAVLTWSHPWDQGSADSSEIVVGAASVVALGSIIASAVALPMERAANLGPGFTTGLLRNARLWLFGLSVAPVLAFLFWLASIGPDSQAGFGAGLLAAAEFAAYWAVARRTLAGADPLTAVQNEGERLIRSSTRMARNGERLARSTFSTSLDDEARTTVLNIYRWRLGGAPIRQLIGASTKRCRAGAPDEGLMLYDAAQTAFRNLLTMTAGATGGFNGVPAEVVGAPQILVKLSMQHFDDFSAAQFTERLGSLTVLPFAHQDTAEVRLQGRGRVRSLLGQVWGNDSSVVPGTAAAQLIRPASSLGRAGLVDELRQVLDESSKTAAQAAIGGQSNQISGPIAAGYLEALRPIALTSDADVRRTNLLSWTDGALRFAVITGASRSLDDPASMFVPGLTPGRSGLQAIIHDIARHADAANLQDLLDVLIEWTSRVLHASPKPRRKGSPQMLGDSLNLLLCLALVAVQERHRLPHPRSLAKQILRASCEWATSPDSGDGSMPDLLRWEDVAAPLWSATIAAGTLSNDAVLLSEHAKEALASLVPDEPGRGLSGAAVNWLLGMSVVAGYTWDEARATAAPNSDEVLDRVGVYRWPAGRGLRGPGCTRPYVFTENAIADTEAWLLSSFPELRAE